jgi:hypothetical protein
LLGDRHPKTAADLFPAQVCHRLKDVIDDSVACQYAIALGAAGLVDVPTKLAQWTTAAKLDTVRRHERAWRSLEYTSWSTLSMPVDRIWEFYGGVWGRNVGNEALCFTQLPSAIRKIGLREWSVPVDIFVRDFSFDPFQDLLVLIDEPDQCVVSCYFQ